MFSIQFPNLDLGMIVLHVFMLAFPSRMHLYHTDTPANISPYLVLPCNFDVVCLPLVTLNLLVFL